MIISISENISFFFLNLISNSQFFQDVSYFNITCLFLQVKKYIFFKVNFEQSILSGCVSFQHHVIICTSENIYFFLKLISNSQLFRDVSNFNITWLFLQVKIYLFFFNLISNTQFFREVSNFNITVLVLQAKTYLFKYLLIWQFVPI